MVGLGRLVRVLEEGRVIVLVLCVVSAVVGATLGVLALALAVAAGRGESGGAG